MSIPNVTVYCGCGSGIVLSSCGCATKKQQQYTTPHQTLPAPTTTCNDGGECPETSSTDCVLWPGADISALGIKTGDPLTKVISIVITALQNIKAGNPPY